MPFNYTDSFYNLIYAFSNEHLVMSISNEHLVMSKLVLVIELEYWTKSNHNGYNYPFLNFFFSKSIIFKSLYSEPMLVLPAYA